MRLYLALGLTALSLLPLSHLNAETLSDDADEITASDSSVDEASELDPVDETVRLNDNGLVAPTGYNRWICAARSNRTYYGYSQWFAQGSGQGQAAHRTAYENALKTCRRFSFFLHCRSDFYRDCFVQRN